MNEISYGRVIEAYKFFCKTKNFDRRKIDLKFVDPKFLNANVGVEDIYNGNETIAAVDSPVGNRKKYRMYISNRDGLSGDDLVESVAHELVHVEQMMNGRLVAEVDNNNNPISFVFEGVKYDRYKNHGDYYRSPWEVEARVVSREWVVEFNRYMRDKRKVKVVKKLV
jgi:hypothetical protein